jgi:hypothetical protein
VILQYIAVLGEAMTISEGLIAMLDCRRREIIGRIWLSQYLHINGIFVESILMIDIGPLFMEDIFQESTLRVRLSILLMNQIGNMKAHD